MIYSIDFEELAGKIRYPDMAKYLRDLGWNQIQSKREQINIFQLENQNGFFQVDIPMSRDLRDYKIAMFRNVKYIAEATHKGIEQVILELLNPLSDILRLRINEPAIEGGSILIEDAIKLYDNAKRLIVAVAMDIVRPRSWHLGRPDKNVSDFVNNCRFGQTEIGSYIVSVVCPISKFDDNNQLVPLSLYSEEKECSQSFTRQVVNKLITSVQNVKNAIAQGTIDSIISADTNSEHCVSANFLDALSGINIYRDNSTLDIAVQYAPTIKNNTLKTPSVSIDHDHFLPIDTFVRKVKSFQGYEKSYVGQIKSLDAAPDPAARTEGKITIVFLDDTRKKSASVILPRIDYDAAIEAHRDGKTVKVTGTISSQPGKKRINCSTFEVLG